MHPIIVEWGSVTIRSYGVMVACGFLLACYLLYLNRNYAKLSADQTSTLAMVAMVAGLAGARIFYVVQYWDYYRGDWSKIIRIDQGGLVFYGGFILAFFALIVYCKLHKIDWVRVLDIATPALAAAHALGRVGCFLNGCCFGSVSELPWAVHYPAGSEADRNFHGEAVHPVQLYETLEQTILVFVYFYLVRRAPRGVAMSCYLIIYGILRFLNELVRGDNPKYFDAFTPAQLVGLLIVPAGIGLLIYFLRAKPARKSENLKDQA